VNIDAEIVRTPVDEKKYLPPPKKSAAPDHSTQLDEEALRRLQAIEDAKNVIEIDETDDSDDDEHNFADDAVMGMMQPGTERRIQEIWEQVLTNPDA